MCTCAILKRFSDCTVENAFEESNMKEETISKVL